MCVLFYLIPAITHDYRFLSFSHFPHSISVHLSITIATCAWHVVLADRVVVSHHCLHCIRIIFFFTHYPTAI